MSHLGLPPAAVSDRARDQLRRELSPDEYAEIRELWKRHSIAEENRDLPGLIATLTEDCVYEIPAWEKRWEGHEGAARFYTQLLTAFPDVHFALTEIVIGPQGVCEEAIVTATHERDWLDVPASGRRLEFQVVIFFPWHAEHRLFQGERVHVSGLENLREGLAKRCSSPGCEQRAWAAQTLFRQALLRQDELLPRPHGRAHEVVPLL